MSLLPKPLELAKHFVKQRATSGSTVIDATLGNGHDALFLTELIGKTGTLIGFDVQEQAIEASRKKLKNAACSIHLHHTGHENMKKYVKDPCSVIMFNLGYLPKSDKSIISQATTTLQALCAACELLENGGLISLMCYPGHSGGDEEAQAVRDFTAELPRKEWSVMEYRFHNAANNPAFLLLLNRAQ